MLIFWFHSVLYCLHLGLTGNVRDMPRGRILKVFIPENVLFFSFPHHKYICSSLQIYKKSIVWRKMSKYRQIPSIIFFVA